MTAQAEKKSDSRAEFLRHAERTEVKARGDADRQEDDANAEHVPEGAGLFCVRYRECAVGLTAEEFSEVTELLWAVRTGSSSAWLHLQTYANKKQTASGYDTVSNQMCAGSMKCASAQPVRRI